MRDDDFDETLELFELEARMAWRAANFNGGRAAAAPSSGHIVHTYGVLDVLNCNCIWIASAVTAAARDVPRAVGNCGGRGVPSHPPGV